MIRIFLINTFNDLKVSRPVVILLFSLFQLFSISQENQNVEELEKNLGALKNDSSRIALMLKYSTEHVGTKSALTYASKAFELSKKAGQKLMFLDASEKIGDAYWFLSDYPSALEYYFKQLKLADSMGVKKSKARAFYNIGYIKCLQLESYKDRSYLLKALKTFESLKDTENYYTVSEALAKTYQRLSRQEVKYVDSALYYFRNVVYFFDMQRNTTYNVSIHNSYANLLLEIGRFKEAKFYYEKGCKEALLVKDTTDYVISRCLLAKLYFKMDSFEKAKVIYDEVFPEIPKRKLSIQLGKAYLERSEIYQKEKKYKEALEYRIMYTKLADSSLKMLHKTDLAKKETEYEVDKREGNIKKLEQLNELSELKNKQNKYIIFGLLFIAVLIIGLTFNLFKRNKEKQKANSILNEKNLLIEEQKQAVEEKNTDITNSINYAKRIQEAILPAKELKYRIFPDAFVLFQPKDIVSGDFYWFAEKNGKRLIAAIDCTGHGVPGAFMSMIGNAFLHEAVNEKGITEPGLILNELRSNIITSLKQSDVEGSTKDGMDMALLSFNASNTEVEFAGANNPLWLIRNGECIEYKGDKSPIGYYIGNALPFTNSKIELKSGDTLYIFTDGYADQFGGTTGKKFKYKQLKEDLISINHLSMFEQEKYLTKKFAAWKHDLEQVDDVCVIGIRV